MLYLRWIPTEMGQVIGTSCRMDTAFGLVLMTKE